ncbi:unnamed protein product [Phytophthora fragariaefolia]|uniref:Unnamed protein product n=1 Tax=Phytophthora fragariaefolia TaxID=1490495 RepID=A0A9W6U2H2_9STRA|nr:unnamed protein product [Phytophthora fragariaefolia]
MRTLLSNGNPQTSRSGYLVQAKTLKVQSLHGSLQASERRMVASCRAETQAYVRELKETQGKLKRELRSEKEKNERIVAKALELEREKSALLASQPQQQTQLSARTQQDTSSDSSMKHQSAWDKEQAHKIHSTLKLTIEELEEELSRKDEEVQTYRERSQRDRIRIKALEDEIRSKDDAQRAAQEARRQLEADLRQAQNDITNELENMQRIHDQAQEDRALRDTMEQQLVTLGEVNAALEQRCRALVRRLELSSAVAQECQDLKLQLRDAEVDNDTLVQTDEQFGHEKDWKVQLESAKEEKAQVEQHVRELQEDLASLQAQNALFSEWMLVRNENTIAAQRDIPQEPENPQQYQQTQPQSESPTTKRKSYWSLEQDYDADCSSSSTYAYRDAGHGGSPRVHHTTSNQRGQRTARKEHDDNSQYIFSKAAMRSRPSTPASPGRASSRKWQSSNSLSPRGAARHHNKVMPRSPRGNARRKMSTTSLSSLCSSATSIAPSAAASSSSSSARNDHDRLRKLMSRNRELQQRLQQETMATQNLEREITNMTS